MSYTIHTSNICNDTGAAFRRTYATVLAAQDALQAALGWDKLYLGDSYSVDDGWAFDAYQTTREANRSGERGRNPCVTFTSEVEED